MCEQMCRCVCGCPQRSKSGTIALGAGVRGVFELSNMDGGIQNQVFIIKQQVPITTGSFSQCLSAGFDAWEGLVWSWGCMVGHSRPMRKVTLINMCLVQVCTSGHPVPDCWEDSGNGRHGGPWRSAGHVYPDRHRWLIPPCWWRVAPHLLPRHPSEPLPIHWGHATGPHHGHGYLFQVWPFPELSLGPFFIRHGFH